MTQVTLDARLPRRRLLRWLVPREPDLAMGVRNAVWRPPFVMYYRTCPLHAVRSDLTASGFTVTTLPLAALGRREDGSPRYRLLLARRAGTP